MAAEIAVARGVPRGNDCQAIGQQRRLKLLLPVEQAVRRELLERAAALQLSGTEREARLDLVDRERQSVEFAVVHLHAQENLHPGGEIASGRFAEIGAQRRIAAAPDDGLGPRHDPALLALAEVQVAVAVGLGLYGSDLGPHPAALREGHLDLLPQPCLQFGQVYVITFHTSQKYANSMNSRIFVEASGKGDYFCRQ